MTCEMKRDAYTFGELKWLLDNQKAEGTKDEPKKSSGSAANVVGGEVAPGVPTDDGVPVEEAVPQQTIGDRKAETVTPTRTTDDNAVAGAERDPSKTRASVAEAPGGGGDVSTTSSPARKHKSPMQVENRETRAQRNEVRRGPNEQDRSFSDGTRSFECLFCHKEFQRKANLELHMHVHTGERPFWCGVCGQEFSQGQSLTGHGRIHTREKPYR